VVIPRGAEKVDWEVEPQGLLISRLQTGMCRV
jgi:hypothetical protein